MSTDLNVSSMSWIEESTVKLGQTKLLYAPKMGLGH